MAQQARLRALVRGDQVVALLEALLSLRQGLLGRLRKGQSEGMVTASQRRSRARKAVIVASASECE